MIHGFTASRAVLEKAAKPLMEAIDRDGSIWISWPKKASKVPTDITEDVIREVVLPIGLVDVKVAAVERDLVGSEAGDPQGAEMKKLLRDCRRTGVAARRRSPQLAPTEREQLG